MLQTESLLFSTVRKNLWYAEKRNMEIVFKNALKIKMAGADLVTKIVGLYMRRKFEKVKVKMVD